MGRWRSDIYEIYTRLTEQAAGRMTSVIGSTTFNDLERGEFHSEELELLPDDLEPLEREASGKSRQIILQTPANYLSSFCQRLSLHRNFINPIYTGLFWFSCNPGGGQICPHPLKMEVMGGRFQK